MLEWIGRWFQASPPQQDVVIDTGDVSDQFVFQPIVASKGDFDVIFIHGITGDPVATWMSSGSDDPAGDFWPHWVHADFPNTNIYALGYPASLFGQWAKKEMGLYERAKATLIYGGKRYRFPAYRLRHAQPWRIARQADSENRTLVTKPALQEAR